MRSMKNDFRKEYKNSGYSKFLLHAKSMHARAIKHQLCFLPTCVNQTRSFQSLATFPDPFSTDEPSRCTFAKKALTNDRTLSYYQENFFIFFFSIKSDDIDRGSLFPPYQSPFTARY